MRSQIISSCHVMGVLITCASALRIGVEMLDEQTKMPLEDEPMYELCRPPDDKEKLENWEPIVTDPTKIVCDMIYPELDSEQTDAYGYSSDWAWLESDLRPFDVAEDLTYVSIFGPNRPDDHDKPPIPLTNNLVDPLKPFEYGFRYSINDDEKYYPAIFEVLRDGIPQAISNTNTLTTDDILMFAGQNKGVTDHQLRVGSDNGPWKLIRSDEPVVGYYPVRLVVTELKAEDVERIFTDSDDNSLEYPEWSGGQQRQDLQYDESEDDEPENQEEEPEVTIMEESFIRDPSYMSMRTAQNLKPEPGIDYTAQGERPSDERPAVQLGQGVSQRGPPASLRGAAREAPKDSKGWNFGTLSTGMRNLLRGKTGNDGNRRQEEEAMAESQAYQPRGGVARQSPPKAVEEKKTSWGSRLNPFVRNKKQAPTVNQEEEKDDFEGASSLVGGPLKLNVMQNYVNEKGLEEAARQRLPLFNIQQDYLATQPQNRQPSAQIEESKEAEPVETIVRPSKRKQALSRWFGNLEGQVTSTLNYLPKLNLPTFGTKKENPLPIVPEQKPGVEMEDFKAPQPRPQDQDPDAYNPDDDMTQNL